MSMIPPRPVPRVPESLLEPLLEAAADALKSLDPADVPPALRRLFAFDPRGLGRGVARQQLRAALDSDDGFRERAVAAYLERAEVQDALARWDVDEALEQMTDAADRSDLPLLASALVAARPVGWEFGLGVVRALYEQAVVEQAVEQEREASGVRISQLEIAVAREETARHAAQQEADRANAALRSERQIRRTRDQEAGREQAVLQRRLDEAQASRDADQEARQAAEARARREAERAAAAEREVRGLRSQLAERAPAAPSIDAPPADAPPATLAEAAAAARRLSAGLDRLATRPPPPPGPAVEARRAGSSPPSAVAPAAPNAGAPRPRGPRAGAVVPAGMRGDSAEGLDAMLHTRGVVLVVDGYNVSMRAWPDAPLDQQRRLLIGALAELHARLRSAITVVFDGADVCGEPLPRRPGVRVVFSSGGEKADPVIIREVRALPERFPVVVVSSDHWVRDHAEAAGAHVVPTDALLRVLRVGAAG
jgi:predicted RNA-binding protein with PIN domain